MFLTLHEKNDILILGSDVALFFNREVILVKSRLVLCALTAVITILFALCQGDKCAGENSKMKRVLPYILIFAWLIFTPVFLDWVISEQYYEILNIHSIMGDNDWFAFLGSYMGVAGTVILGAVSFRQANMLAKKDEKLAAYQAEPRIRVNSVSVLPYYSDSKGGFDLLKKSELERVSFIQYGTDVTYEGSFVIIRLEVVDIGTLPVNKLEIKNIVWSIGKKESFKIELTQEKWKNLDLLAQVYLIVDTKDESGGKFFSEISKHFDYWRTIEYGYNKSELQILFSLCNAEHKDVQYRLICRFDLENANVEFDYFVSSGIIHIRKE